MAARLRKSNKANLAENSSDDSDDSDYINTRNLSYKDKQKKKYCKSINNLCDTDSNSDSEVSKEFYKSRLAAASRVGTRKKDCEVIYFSDSAEASDPSDLNTNISKQNTKDKKKRKRKSASEESTPESAEKSTKVNKKMRSSNEKSSKHSSKNNSHIDNNDSSSSKEFQEPKAKRKSNLNNSFERCELNDYSTVNTPSRTDEDKLSVESLQEISFKHYVIQEIKKFQELNNRMQEDLELNNDYLLKKKIKTVSDAKFFVHKILNIYDTTFAKFRENRKNFVKTYDTWTSDVSKKPKEVLKKSRFSLSSGESDDNTEAPSIKEKSLNVSKNGSFSEKAKKDSNESIVPEAGAVDESIDARLSRSASKAKPKRNEVATPVSDGNETGKRPEVSSDAENKSPRKERQGKLKLKAKMNESVSSEKAVEESDADSVVQASGCDSDAIFSSEESKSRRKGKPEEKAEEANETPISKEKAANEDADSRSSASEDLFETTTGEVVNTPVKPVKVPRVPIDVDVIADTRNETDEVVEEPAEETEEPSVLDTVEDPKEREALQKLMADCSSDADADSEDEGNDEEGATAKGRAKHLKRQTKKRNLCSDSSSSDDAKGRSTRAKRRGNNEASDLRTAPRQRIDLRGNRFYLADEKLRRECRVEVERLPASELARHAWALDKSKDYVERKKIESLANLDNIESKGKSKAKSAETSESDEPDCAVKERPNKSKPKKDEKMSVVDCLGKKGESDSEESSDERDNGQEPADPADADEPMEESLDEAERKAKEALLGTSSESASSDEEAEKDTEANGDSEKQDAAKDKKSKKNESSSAESDHDEDAEKKKEKATWKNDKLLNFKLDGSETEEEKFHKSQEKKKSKGSDTEKDKNPDESGSSAKGTKGAKKSRKKRRILDSDSDAQSASEDDNAQSSAPDESEEEKDEEGKKKKKRRRAQSSDSDTSTSGKKQKSKRKRIKKVASDSDSDDKDSPGKGRKNIRRVLKDKYVTDDTKKAAQDEEERLKRIADRQKLFNQMYEDRLANEEKVEQLVLDIDEETKEELVVVDKELAKRLKPHQARGIKFMWDACYESIEQVEKSDGSGCIIAHCMGLGKTFQVVTLTHTLLTHERTGVRTVMIVCPLSTVLNWVNEFKIWLKHVKNSDEIEIFEMTKLKKNIERKCVLENWRNYGGVLIIGYEMFRNLTSTGKKMRKNMQESVMKSLVDPGADLVVCDEGHLLKNEDSALSKAMKLVKTMRRIVLTGTPLQNNLKEYHCMVQFVKPNLLGTKKEFLNRFVNPITNGQFDDSTPYDVKLMKKRAHVLHKMLEGSVQRFDYSVLTPFLPPKQEYVIFLRLTEKQIKLYQYYLENLARRAGGRMSLFADFQALQRIWTHPYVLRLNAEKVEKADEKRRLEASDSEGSLKDFIDDDSTSASEASLRSSNSSDSDVECLDSDNEKAGATARKRGTRANPVAEDPEEQPAEEAAKEAAWWSQFVDEEKDFNDLRISTKLMLLFSILKESESIGDKVLVFSQSLYSLTLIEHFLNLMDDATQTGVDTEHLNEHTGTWTLGNDYFRLDGSTSAENRSIWSKIFNNPKNTRARLFLISTRAGGLGINLIGANRVIIFDASWNPSHDVQSIFRIYRFGQKKPCYVYRFLAAGTMEEKIYNRQVTKLSLACRVVDEQQIERHYSNTDLAELYQFDTCEEQIETLNLPKDRMLAEIFIKYKEFIVKCHEHDSLLENKEEEELDEEERKQAWVEYEEEKKGIRQQNFNNVGNNFAFNQMLMNMNAMSEFQGVKQLLQKDYPDVPPEHLDVLTRQAMFDMYRMIDQQAVMNNMNNFRPQQAPMPQQNNFGGSTIDAIMRQQSLLMNQSQPQPQPNYYGVNQMPAYSGRGRPPKYTSVNNQIVTNPMYMSNAQAMHSQQQQQQQQQSVPSDNEVQVINEPSLTSSSKQATSNAKN